MQFQTLDSHSCQEIVLFDLPNAISYTVLDHLLLSPVKSAKVHIFIYLTGLLP